jgi:hypothetical protein
MVVVVKFHPGYGNFIADTHDGGRGYKRAALSWPQIIHPQIDGADSGDIL